MKLITIIHRALLFISVFFVFSSCSQGLGVKETQIRNKAKNLIIRSFPKELDVNIYAFENLTTNFSDEDYLSTAIPEMILSYLKPLEMEKVEIPLEFLTLNIPSGLETQILKLSNIYSNYLTNVTAWTTQYQRIPMTNELWQIAMSNATFNPIRKDTILSNIWEIALTNEEGDTNGTNLLFAVQKTSIEHTNIFLINDKQTNKISMIIYQTNGTNTSFSKKLTLTRSGYLALLTNEFQDALSNLSLISVRVQKKTKSGFIPTNYTRNTVYVGGTFEVEPGKAGPAKIAIEMKLIQLRAKTNILTNRIETREDKVADRVYDLIAPLRRFVLKKPGGELIISTQPDEVSVYLDGVFIGKTPTRYPYVLEGKHQLLLRRSGFGERYLKIQIDANVTNWVDIKLDSLNTGGHLSVSADPTNAQVFLDSHFIGKTPISISNLILNKKHRLKVRPLASNLKPAYLSFTFTNRSDNLTFKPKLKTYEGLLLDEQRTRWISAYAGWGISVGILAYSIYQHYQMEYLQDKFYTDGNTNYSILAHAAELQSKNSFNYFIVGSFVASGLTKWALDGEQIYIGWSPSDDGIEAKLAFRF